MVIIIDRVSKPTSNVTNVSRGADWQTDSMLEKHAAGRRFAQEFIERMENGIKRNIISLVFSGPFVDKVEAAYTRAGIIPSIGLCGLDLIFPNAKYPSRKDSGNYPFVCEMHHVFELPIKGLENLLAYYSDVAKGKGKSLVVPPDGTITGLPQLLEVSMLKLPPTPLYVGSINIGGKYWNLRAPNERQQAIQQAKETQRILSRVPLRRNTGYL
jgi:hypothetical protein